MDFIALLGWTVYGNKLYTWLLALLVFILSLVALQVVKGTVQRVLAGVAQRTRSDLDDLAAQMLADTRRFFLFLLSLHAGSLVLDLPPKVTVVIGRLTVLAVLAQAAIWGNRLITLWISRYAKARLETDASSVATISALGLVGRVAFWAVLILLALQNLGVEITALLAGLGVGGIAVALAVQNILGDLFASLSIMLDKPFVVGDFIIVNEYLGTVEHIGLKTTRLRSLSGEQLVFANSDLLQSRIRNYKRMFERRVLFTVGVTYQTPAEKLAAIPTMIREIVETQANTRFDRSHFKEFGDFSLSFETVYYVLVPDYNVYMDIQQTVNLTLFQRFATAGIEFAYPTQTLFVSPTAGAAPEVQKAGG